MTFEHKITLREGLDNNFLVFLLNFSSETKDTKKTKTP